MQRAEAISQMINLVYDPRAEGGLRATLKAPLAPAALAAVQAECAALLPIITQTVSLSEAAVTAYLGRLAQHFPTRDRTGGQWALIFEDYLQDLRAAGYSADDLREACTQWRRTRDFFPTSHELLEACRVARGRNGFLVRAVGAVARMQPLTETTKSDLVDIGEAIAKLRSRLECGPD